jgi:hypothetical protein
VQVLKEPIEGLAVQGVSDLRGLLRYGLEHTKADIDCKPSPTGTAMCLL